MASDGVVLAEAGETGGRSTQAFGMIEKVLAEANVQRAEIGAIAVGLGPGSYTGIRAAIAIAQGWQLARPIKLIGISSVKAIAARARSEKISGNVNVVVDTQRGEFYLATWNLSATEGREISPLKIVAATEVETRQRSGEICIGPATGTILFPSAAMVAQLASRRTEVLPDEKLEPIYLRVTNFVKMPATPSPAT